MIEEYRYLKTYYIKGKPHNIYVSNFGNAKYDDRIVENPTKIGGMRAYLAVAKLFIPNPENKPEIDHIDTNNRNNRADNLRWVTHQENMNNKITRKHLSEAAKKRWEDGIYEEMSNNMIGHIPWNKGLPKEQQPAYGRKPSLETRQKMSQNRKGKGLGKWSDERKKELSNKLKGREFTPEWRQKISNANKGKSNGPLSEEHKRKISEGNKRRWERKRKDLKNTL